MTSIEWLIEQLGIYGDKAFNKEITLGEYHIKRIELIEKAKEMHKQDIINSVLFGMQKGLNINKVPETDNDWVNNYYQDTFKKD